MMDAPQSRFKYFDTHITRYGIGAIEEFIQDEIVAVIGVGGSGSYLVDILAKTNVKELHLFDDDLLLQHNAFRLAGAARVEEIGQVSKVAWHTNRYAAVRESGVFGHEGKIDPESMESIDELRRCTIAFIAVDDPKDRREIQRACGSLGVDHIALGIGVTVQGEDRDTLGGMVNVEVQWQPEQVATGRTAEPSGAAAVGEPNAYGRIQTAELNMLSAAIAVIEWKALRGFYRRDEVLNEHRILYVLSGGNILIDRVTPDAHE